MTPSLSADSDIMTGNLQNFEHQTRKNNSRLESDTAESVECSIPIKPEHMRPNAVPRLKPRSSFMITKRLTHHRIMQAAHTKNNSAS
jgi:hypothetical protein